MRMYGTYCVRRLKGICVSTARVRGLRKKILQKTEPVRRSPVDRMLPLREIRNHLMTVGNGSDVMPTVSSGSEAPYSAFDALQYAKAPSYSNLRERKLFNDAEEVLRKANKEDVKKFMKFSYRNTMLGDDHSERAILGKIQAHYSVLQKSEDDHSKAWLQILESLTDEDLRLLWSCGFIDYSAIEDLIESAEREPTNSSSNSSSTESPLSSFHYLSEKVNQMKNAKYGGQLTRGIYESVFSDFPSVDLAPTVEKVLLRRLDSVSKTELSDLEKHEEAKTLHLCTSTSKSASVSEAELNRALLPSNYFLASAALHDSDLQQSLDVMERIKGSTLLDESFQATLGAVDAVTTPAMENHETRSSKRRSNAKAEREMKKNPFSFPQRTTDVPFFYGVPHSVVPPHGQFSLPAPRISRQTKRERKNRKKAVTRHKQ